MKSSKQTALKSKVATNKVFKPLDKKQLGTVIGGPVGSRGTVTLVQDTQ